MIRRRIIRPLINSLQWILRNREKIQLFIILLSKAILNWCTDVGLKPKGNNLIHGVAFIDFYHLPEAEGHHGTCAFLLDPDIRPENYSLWGPFGYADSIHTKFHKQILYLYQMDWGIPGPEHFADSDKLTELAKANPTKKILLVGVRTVNGKFWWLYRSPKNFMLVPK